jgi:hypothetical protein
LCFIDDQHHPVSLGVFIDQEARKRIVERDVVLVLVLEPETHADPLQQPSEIQAGIADQPHGDGLFEVVEQMPDEGRLA